MTRLLSGVALAAAAFAAILFLPFPGLRVMACLVAALGAYEYLGIVDPPRRSLDAAPILILVALVCWLFSDPGSEARPGAVGVLLLLGVGWAAVEVVWRRLAVARVRARLLAPLYLGMPLGMLVAVQIAGGRMATLLLIASVVVSDTAQYYSGRRFGRRPLAPKISPGKTIEGAIGGLVIGTVFVTVAGQWVFPQATPVVLALLGVTVVVLGIFGDLFESRLKRAAGVKDSSWLIPGHGGVLDRIDALLFAVPVYYVYLLS